ncbi:hypothetical protein KFE25_007175 [Diacronema lutheri]|uniref:DEUBAD domain-containing protein n=1 Tax=Diacronema lutheri TaxID=2081491 RepID=A0A8J5XIF8_DIALT|nr:hypothetical protein KFE25_007175 [Diacronema lutheri]
MEADFAYFEGEAIGTPMEVVEQPRAPRGCAEDEDMPLLPDDVCDALRGAGAPLLRQIVCPEVWSTLFTADEREQLAAHLPLTPAATADVQMIGRLARKGGDSFHFVHPFERVIDLLNSGALCEDGARRHAAALRVEREAHRERVRAYHDGMVDALLMIPSTWLLTARRPLVQLLAPTLQAKLPPAKRARKPDAPGALGGAACGTDGCGAIASASPPPPPSAAAAATTAPPPSSFLALVREAICQAPDRIAPTEYLCRQVARRLELLPAGLAARWLPAEVTARDYLLSALKFLAAPPPEYNGAEGAVELPTAPLLAFDSSTQAYTWVGRRHTPALPAVEPAAVASAAAARATDAAADDDDDDELAVVDCLDEMHAALYGQQLSNGAAFSTGRFGAQSASALLGRAVPRAGATVVRTSAAAAERFREQETVRYAQPDRPFRFEFTARDSTGAERTFFTAVAAVKRGAPNPSTKPREHALLRSERPAHVTILTLVRDAAARLPDGVGTRADVSELLRDSQFVVDGASEAQLAQVVSGALDRLHYEKDACVRYEPERKLWIYLHRNRALDEFGQAQAGSARKRPAPPPPGAPTPAQASAGLRGPVQPLPPGAAPPPGTVSTAGLVRPAAPRPQPAAP